MQSNSISSPVEASISPRVSHVLFTLDGLLLDSEKLYTEAFTQVCARYGKEFTWELKASLLGVQGHECAQKIISELELSITEDEFLEQCNVIYQELFPTVELMPGAERLVRHLYNKGVRIAVATSSSLQSVDLKMQNHQDLLKCFHHVTTGCDPEVAAVKPDPAVFLVCASKFPEQPRPEDCLVFEDSVNGVLAARAAGMQVVMVPDPRVDATHLQATLVLQSLEDFQPQAFGLPSYSRKPIISAYGPWVPVNSEDEVQAPKVISKNPNFFLVTKKILRQMKPLFEDVDDDEFRDVLKPLLLDVLKKRISDMLEGIDEYMTFKQIFNLYRCKYPVQSDKRLIEQMCLLDLRVDR